MPRARRLVYIPFLQSCQRFLFTLIMALHRVFKFWSGGSSGCSVVKDYEWSKERGRGFHFQGALFLSVRTSVTNTGNSGSPGANFKDESSRVSRTHNRSRWPKFRTAQANHRRVSPLASLYLKMVHRASLVAQWLRICLLVQGTRVRALVREDPTCRGATKPVRHNY